MLRVSASMNGAGAVGKSNGSIRGKYDFALGTKIGVAVGLAAATAAEGVGDGAASATGVQAAGAADRPTSARTIAIRIGSPFIERNSATAAERSAPGIGCAGSNEGTGRSRRAACRSERYAEIVGRYATRPSRSERGA